MNKYLVVVTIEYTNFSDCYYTFAENKRNAIRTIKQHMKVTHKDFDTWSFGFIAILDKNIELIG